MRRRMMAWALVLVTAAGGCSIPTEGGPEALPGGVVAPVQGDPGDTGPTPAPMSTLFLVRGGCVVPVSRTLSQPGLAATLRRLFDGPLESEVATGLRSAIPPQSELRSVRAVDGTAVIDLAGTFVDVGGEEQILAVAQLVLTATEVPGIERARIELEGTRVEVPAGDGTLVSGPLVAQDYAAIRGECEGRAAPPDPADTPG